MLQACLPRDGATVSASEIATSYSAGEGAGSELMLFKLPDVVSVPLDHATKFGSEAAWLRMGRMTSDGSRVPFIACDAAGAVVSRLEQDGTSGRSLRMDTLSSNWLLLP